MATSASADFLAGVIEGFYGEPWTQAERSELFEWMAAWGLNTYLYAPKDDLKHRAIWRESYNAPEAERLGEVIQACRQRHIRFIYGLSPGLDIRYGNEADLNCLQQRFEQMLALGCQDFALLFDDIPDRVSAEEIKRWGSLASAQAHVVNSIFRWTREHSAVGRFLFCPTPYCGRMAERKLGGENYLATLGRELTNEIDVFWTGPEIVSREISVAHIRELQSLLRRRPLIWDNLHANDYDGTRFFCGPYAGRPTELRGEVSGLLSNPNCEFPLNYVPLRTLGEFVRGAGPWDARKAYLTAMREWLPRFETAGTPGRPITLEDLILLGDCYYLPQAEGPEAEALYEGMRTLLARPSEEPPVDIQRFRQHAVRLRDLCVRLTELRQRSLFHAFSRRIWDLREELDLLERYLRFSSENTAGRAPGPLDLDLPDTHRGGMVSRLRRLLVERPDGTFTVKEEGAGGKKMKHRTIPTL